MFSVVLRFPSFPTVLTVPPTFLIFALFPKSGRILSKYLATTHESVHLAHLVHSFVIRSWGSSTIALTGQTFRHNPHFVNRGPAAWVRYWDDYLLVLCLFIF